MNYYNEFDKKAAAWLRELIAQGHLPPGDVDERSIQDVKPHELTRYTQCHFFAGIGGWSLALQLAGWSADRRVWTGSCPCQPFSSAGRGKGVEDPRHLWPVFRELIRECQPPTVFGEQVASPAGRRWLSGVFADLEAMAYRRAGADLCAAGFGAPHIRQRLYWVGDSFGAGLERHRRPIEKLSQIRREDEIRYGAQTGGAWDFHELLSCEDGKSRRVEAGTFPLADGVPGRVGLLRGYGNAIVPQVASEFVQAYDESH